MLAAPPMTRITARGTPAASGEWSFTDDHGTTLTLPKHPERVVAHLNSGATLWDDGIQPIGIFGELVHENGDVSPLLGNVNLEGVTILGDTYGPIDLVALAAFKYPAHLIPLNERDGAFTADNVARANHRCVPFGCECRTTWQLGHGVRAQLRRHGCCPGTTRRPTWRLHPTT